MPDELSPNIKVRRDLQGNVRQLSHPYEQLGPTAAVLSAGPNASDEFADLALRYLHECAPLFGFEASPDGRASGAALVDKIDLRPSATKVSGGNLVVVSFDQYVDGWPVWRAGVTVRIDSRRMKVTGSQNATHLGIRLHRASPDAPLAAQRVDATNLAQHLALGSGSRLTLSGSRTLVYRFRREERLDLQCEPQGQEESEDDSRRHVKLPLVLPELPQEILQKEGQHFVVTEVLFALPLPGWGVLNWRAFIEPDSGAVLYLRSLVSCAARGHVFLLDPASASGQALTPASPIADLHALRQSISLQGLGALNSDQQQELSGEFVKLVNVEPPSRRMPSESSPFDFDYSCDTANFAACCAYHHCDGVFRWMQGVGIDVHSYFTHTAFPISVDPHAFDRGVNAQAVGNADGRGLAQFLFGAARGSSDFGIATDIRVVLHEFGHALLWEHIGSPNFGFAHSPGDSLAAILQDPLSRAQDSGATFPFIRGVPGFDRRHDRDVAAGWAWFGGGYDRRYKGEQVLSSSLFRAYRAAGGDSTVSAEKQMASSYVAYLIVRAIESFQIKPEHADDLVQALIEADARTEVFQEMFPGGALGKVFRWAFEKQGLYQPEGAPLPANAAGAPPPVDVYIDDGRGGEYLPYLQDLGSPPGIWNRRARDGMVDNEEPRADVPNFAFVRVCNRGTLQARDVEISVFQASRNGPRRWGIDWARIPHALPVLESIPSGGEAIIGPVEWTPKQKDDHLLVCVSAPGDPSSLDESDPIGISVEQFVRLDNNVAERRF